MQKTVMWLEVLVSCWNHMSQAHITSAALFLSEQGGVNCLLFTLFVLLTITTLLSLPAFLSCFWICYSTVHLYMLVT